MSFGKVLTEEEAAALVEDSPVGGVLLAYEVEQGPSVKVTYAPVDADPTDVATIARAASSGGTPLAKLEASSRPIQRLPAARRRLWGFVCERPARGFPLLYQPTSASSTPSTAAKRRVDPC